MQRWRGQDEIPTDWGRCVVTIGVFDGVHRGHAELINHAVKAGRTRGIPTVLMTFDPHPMEVVFPGSHPAQLTTLTRRAELVEEMGIDTGIDLGGRRCRQCQQANRGQQTYSGASLCLGQQGGMGNPIVGGHEGNGVPDRIA